MAPSYAIVWTQLPMISWIFPFIGHAGITDSEGRTYDFQGPYTVVKNNFAFGRILRYVPIDAELNEITAEEWNRAVLDASQEYQGHNHTLLWDNCHSHVANALNRLRYGNRKWGNISVGVLVFFKGRFTDTSAIVQTFLPSLIFWALVVVLSNFIARNFKRNGVFVGTVIASAFVFEMAFDTATDYLWDSINRGRQWKDIEHKYKSQ